MKSRPSLFIAAILAVACAMSTTAHAADEPDELIGGKIAIVKPGKLAKFVAKPAGADFVLPSVTNDPTGEGALIRFFDLDPGGAGSFVFNLPAAGWVGLGSPAGAKGFKYKGTGTAGDPCKVVMVKPTVIKAVCKGADVAFTLPFSGNLGSVIEVGTDTKRYCLEFGGEAKGDPNKLFKRKNAPPPGTCPQVGPAATATRTNTTAPAATATRTNTIAGPVNTPTRTPTRTNTVAGPASTPTRTPTRTNTIGAPASTATRTATPAGSASCGNGLINSGEACMTCPTGQTCQGCLPGQSCMACPADCTVSPCTLPGTPTTITFRVNLSVPPGQDVGTIGVLLGYRSNLVSLPTAASSRFTNLQPGGNRTVTDFDYGVQYLYTLATGLNSGGLYTVRFDRCQGAPAPIVSDFTCIMQACVGNAGEVSGCDCVVTTP